MDNNSQIKITSPKSEKQKLSSNNATLKSLIKEIHILK